MSFSTLKTLLTLSTFLFLTGCASFLKTQSAIELSLERNDFSSAVTAVEKADYGKNNELLMFLDRVYIYHTAGDYGRSIDAALLARRKFDEVYTKSVSKEAASFALNDYLLEYAGEDYERVLLNGINALNYFKIGNTTDALVEMRDADSFLKAAKTDDGFIRLLEGILYEASSLSHDRNDAAVAYRRAHEIYSAGYNNIPVPILLRQNMQSPLPGDKARVYLIQYAGCAPVKEEASLIVPIPGDQRIVKVAFPEYRENILATTGAFLIASGPQELKALTETVEDIDALARKALNARKAQKIAKTIARNAVRYAAQEKISDKINESNGGGTAALAFDIASGIFNAVIEQADLRSWRLLPARINIAKLDLKPGQYTFSARPLSGDNASDDVSLGSLDIQAGKTYIFITASRR